MTPREKMQSLGRSHATAGVAINEDLARQEASRLTIGSGEALQIYRQAYHTTAQTVDRDNAHKYQRAMRYWQDRQTRPQRTGRVSMIRGSYSTRRLGASAW